MEHIRTPKVENVKSMFTKTTNTCNNVWDHQGIKWKGATCINPHASRSFQKFEHIRGRLQQVVNGGEEIKTKLPRSSTQFCRCCYKVMNQGLGENANYLFSHLSLRAHCHGFKVFSNVHVWLDSLSGNIFVALLFSSCSFLKTSTSHLCNISYETMKYIVFLTANEKWHDMF